MSCSWLNLMRTSSRSCVFGDRCRRSNQIEIPSSDVNRYGHSIPGKKRNQRSWIKFSDASTNTDLQRVSQANVVLGSTKRFLVVEKANFAWQKNTSVCGVSSTLSRLRPPRAWGRWLVRNAASPVRISLFVSGAYIPLCPPLLVSSAPWHHISERWSNSFE